MSTTADSATAAAAVGPLDPDRWGAGWDLTLIAEDAAAVELRLESLVVAAESLRTRYQGRVAALSPSELRALLDELGDLKEELRVLCGYSELRLAAQVDDAEAKDLATVVARRRTEAEDAWRFVDLEWSAMPDEEAESLAQSGLLAPYRHHLRALRRFAPYHLSGPAEQAFAARRAAAEVGWQELFQEQVGDVAADFDGGDGREPHSLDRLLSYATAPDRARRRDAYQTLYQALEPKLPVLAAAYDALVADRLGEDRLRGRQDPMTLTNLGNQLPDAVVVAMLKSCHDHQEIARRWFRAKARLLGHELALYDTYAPLGRPAAELSYPAAQTLVLDQFERFSPRLAEAAAGFFAGRIDAEPRLGKAGGAFCTEFSRAVKPFVLVNYSGRLEDAVTLAHELGHGVQFELTAGAQPPLVTESGLALAEVPSTFAEMVVFDGLLAREADPAIRLHLLSGNVEQAFASVFRQASLCRFEQRAYAARQAGKSLRPERLNELWLEVQRDYLQDSVVQPDWAGWGWSYISHFIHTRFYTYAYSFAHLVALTLFDRYRSGSLEAERYLDFLAYGGAEDPAHQLAALGVDVRDPDVWTRAFAELDRRVDEAVRLADELARTPPPGRGPALERL